MYPYLKNGEIWRDIKEELDDINVKPTSDDSHWMDTCIEEAQESTEQAIINQGKFDDELKEKAQKELDNYFDAIRLKSQINAGSTLNGKNSSQHSSKSMSSVRAPP